MFKSLVLISSFVILSCITSFGQGDWEKIKTPTDYNLLKVCYFDSLHCWVAGDSGVIMFSSDQGVTWEIQNSGVTNFISDIYFLDKNFGWAVTFETEGINSDIRSKVLKTSDGGVSWEVNNYRHLNTILTTIFFHDSLHGWVGSDRSGISFTKDGGYNWFESTIDTGAFGYFPVEQIEFSTPKYGFAVGGQVDNAGVCWSTSDSGKIWKPHGIGPDLILDFVFLDTTRVISLTAEYEGFFPNSFLDFDLTNNSWTYDSLSFYAFITGMSKRNDHEIWGASSRLHPGFVYLKNQESEWQLIINPDSSFVNDITFSDSLNGIAVGEAGYIFKYVPDSVVSVNDLQAQVPSSFVLEQNYPNPFNPSTVIQYTIGSRQFVSIKVYDVLGNEIASLVNEEKPPGSYSLQFTIEDISTSQTGSQLSSGVYFYQLKASNFVETKKMLLLK